MTGPFMVVIQCPNCGKDVELEDGASGLFDCPYCSEVFEYIGTEILDEDLELIDDIQNGLHHHSRIFSRYKFRRDYKWYHILGQCLLVLLGGVGIFLLLETAWNIPSSKRSQFMIVYLPEEDNILKYEIVDFKPCDVQRLVVDNKMEIKWSHVSGSDGMYSNSDTYTIVSSTGEKIDFVATWRQKCNIKSFAGEQNIPMYKS